MTQIRAEIFWPSELPEDAAIQAQQTLGMAGIPTVCRRDPTRRSASLSIVVILSMITAQPLLQAIFTRIGDDAYQALRDFVISLRRGHHRNLPPVNVVFESDATGTRVVFPPDLPDEGYRLALHIDQAPGCRVWIWGSREHGWLVATDQRGDAWNT